MSRQSGKIRGHLARIIPRIPAPDLFLDFGPGTKNSEAWEAQMAWPNCKIVGVEACEHRYEKLKPVYPGKLYHMAVDEKVGQTEGYVGGYHGMFKFGLEKETKPRGDNHKKVTVPTTTADELYENSDGGDVFIWADIEGAELRMLKGATSLLSSGRVLGLNLELFPENPTKAYPTFTGNRPSAKQVIDFLSEYGYECCGSGPNPNLIYGDFESKRWNQDFLFLRRDR